MKHTAKIADQPLKQNCVPCTTTILGTPQMISGELHEQVDDNLQEAITKMAKIND